MAPAARATLAREWGRCTAANSEGEEGGQGPAARRHEGYVSKFYTLGESGQSGTAGDEVVTSMSRCSPAHRRTVILHGP